MFLADSVLMYSDCAVIHLSNCADIDWRGLLKLMCGVNYESVTGN